MAVFKKFRGKRIDAKDKNWDKGTWYIWKRIKGAIIHKSLPEARTKQQAEEAERAIINERFNRRYGGPDNTTFVDFGRGRYTRFCEHQNANIGAKRLYIETLCKAFKGKSLIDITPQDCRDVQAKLRKGTLSDSSVNRIMSTASRMFSLACEEGILDRNPMQYVKTLKEPQPRSRLLTVDEKERLWKELEKDTLLLQIVTLAINLPLRRGQLLALTPDAIDWQNGQIFTIGSKGRQARTVPLNSTALTTLKLMNENGHLPFPLRDFRKRWHRALIAAGVNSKNGKRGENFTFHDLRKEFASELIRKNVNPNIIQKLFAHSDMSITNVYMHSEMDDLKAAVNTLDATDVQPTQNIEGLPN